MEINGSGRADITAMLEQMRALRAQITSPTETPARASEATGIKPDAPEFGALLREAVDSVNHLQQTASRSSGDFVAGREDNLVKVMVDGQKASIGFQAMVQVRNRMVSAYQDIMKMPI